MSKFGKVTLLVVLALLFVGGDALAFGREVFQITATVPVVGAQTNAVVNVERGGRVTLDASASAMSGTFSWRVLGGPENVTLLDSNSLFPYFRPSMPGVYRFMLEISDGASTEIKEVAVEVRDLYFVQIRPRGRHQMRGIETYPVAYPRNWPPLYETQAWATASTTDNPRIDIRGTAGRHTATLKATNFATGAEYTGTLIENHGRLEFSFTGIALQEGDNLVKIIGIDDLGITCFDALFVTYNPSVNFVRPLGLSVGHILEGEEKNIEFSLQVKFQEGYPIPENIALYEATGSGELIRKIGELTLRGAPELGTYSAVLTLQNITENKFYRAVLPNGQKSVTAILFYIPKLNMDSEERKRINDVIDSIKRQVMIDAGRIYSLEELDRRIEMMAEMLNDREDVRYVYIRGGGSIGGRSILADINVAFTSIIGSSTGFDVVIGDWKDEYSNLSPPNLDEESIIGSNRVISLHPFIAEMAFGWGRGVGHNDLFQSTRNLFRNNPLFSSSYTAIINSDIRMQHYRNLARAGISLIFIHVAAHAKCPRVAL